MGLLDTIAEPDARHDSAPSTSSRTSWGRPSVTATDRSRTVLGPLVLNTGRRGRPASRLIGTGRARAGRARPDQLRSGTLRRARRIVWRWRFALAGALFGLAVGLTVHLLRPPPPPTVDVAVTARPIAAGSELTRDDIAVRAVAADLAPPGTVHTVRGLLGRAAVVGLPAGAPLHRTLVSDTGVSAAAPHGTVVVPVRLSDDAVAALLRPGDRVDLLSGTTSGSEPTGAPQYLARGALVLPVPDGRAAEGTGGLLGQTQGADRPVTLVAVTPKDAPELSAVSGWGSVTAVLVP